MYSSILESWSAFSHRNQLAWKNFRQPWNSVFVYFLMIKWKELPKLSPRASKRRHGDQFNNWVTFLAFLRDAYSLKQSALVSLAKKNNGFEGIRRQNQLVWLTVIPFQIFTRVEANFKRYNKYLLTMKGNNNKTYICAKVTHNINSHIVIIWPDVFL